MACCWLNLAEASGCERGGKGQKEVALAKSCVMSKCTTGRLGRLEYRSLHGKSQER